MKRIAVFASGSGSNFQRIAEYFAAHPSIHIASLYCNKPGAFVIHRADSFRIPSHVFSREEWKEGKVLRDLQSENIDYIVLAGFLWLVPAEIIRAFPDRIINIHPALLPSYGGKGMYGHFVHEAVIADKAPESGITIHLVNEEYDRGEHLFQAKTPVFPTDTPDDLAARIHELEHRHFPEEIERYILGREN